jgi:hypothetical protein
MKNNSIHDTAAVNFVIKNIEEIKHEDAITWNKVTLILNILQTCHNCDKSQTNETDYNINLQISFVYF